MAAHSVVSSRIHSTVVDSWLTLYKNVPPCMYAHSVFSVVYIVEYIWLHNVLCLE